MSDLFLRLPNPQAAVPPQQHLPIGRVMVNAGLISQSDLVHALDLQKYIDAPLGEILVAEGLSTPSDILQMLSHQHNIPIANLAVDPPDPSLSAALPSAICLKYRCVPWLRIGDILFVGTQHPDDFQRLRTSLGDRGNHILPVLVQERQIVSHISVLYGPELAQKAATRVPAAQSCRSWNPTSVWRKPIAFSLLTCLCLALVLAPAWTITIGVLLAFITLLMSTVLKLAAFITQISTMAQETPIQVIRPSAASPLPKVSVLVPLLHEKEIAGKLVQRLTRLTYPKSQLEIVLVL